MENPAENCEHTPAFHVAACSKLWKKINADIYMDAQARLEMEDLLDSLVDNVSHVQYGIQSLKSEDDRMARDMEGMQAIESAREFIRRLINLRPLANEPERAENLNVLISHAVSFLFCIKRCCNFTQPPEPKHRIHWRTKNRPSFPVYPEGILNSKELEQLHNIRDGMEKIFSTDMVLESLPPDDEAFKRAVKEVPCAILLGNNNGPQEINEMLQSKYAELHNHGVGIFARSLGWDAAETAMEKEVEIIQNHFSQPSPSCVKR